MIGISNLLYLFYLFLTWMDDVSCDTDVRYSTGLDAESEQKVPDAGDRSRLKFLEHVTYFGK